MIILFLKAFALFCLIYFLLSSFEQSRIDHLKEDKGRKVRDHFKKQGYYGWF